MTGRYLTDLADVLRAAGLTVVEVDGWQTRARSSGGFANGRPTHLMVHHTASPPRTDGWPDVNYIVNGSPVRPVSQIYTDRKGVVYVCAAGATNTNGQGRDSWGGGVPDDQMNLYAIANEIANDGVGEPYPAAQQASVLKSAAAICAHYGIGTHRVRAHFEWAPGRKVDPRGASMWAPNGGMWDMDAFRHDVGLALEPTPSPMIDEVDMICIDHNPGTPEWTALTYTGTQLAHVVNGHADAVMRRAGVARQTVTDAELDGLIRSAQTTTPCPPAWVNTPRGSLWTAARG